MRFKTIATVLATVVLSTVLAPIAVSMPAQAQSQTNWHVNDDPSLFGPSQYWYWCNPGHGYGSNNCRFTYASGGESTATNWAQWNLGSRVGRQEIQVYVPSDHATATVNYNITIGSNTYKRAVAQRNISRWHSLGNWNTNGANVVIAVYDNDASHHWERDGYVWSSIGVDAIRMRCVSNCPSPPPPPPPPPPSTYPEQDGTPSAPRNLRLSLTDDNSFRATWDQPSSSGGSRITKYVIRVSRLRLSASVDPFSRTYERTSRSFTFNGRNGATYTVRVAAMNGHRTGPAASESIATESTVPKPEDLYVFGPDDVDSTSPHLRAAWGVPAGRSTSGLRFQVTISRGSIGGDGGWRRTRTTSNRHYTFGPLRAGVAYTVRVITVDSSGRQSAPAIYEDAVALGRPIASLDNEGTSWIFDDPDALVEWTRVTGATGYQLDWRYMEIDTDRLRKIYSRLQEQGLTTRQRDELTTEASQILAGSELSVNRISGDSRPNRDTTNPEVTCFVQSRLCSVSGSTSAVRWDPLDPEFRIHSRNEDYVLQARVKAIGPRIARGGWSGWAFHPDAKFAAGCRALEYYDNIKTILRAIDIAGFVLTAVGIAGAAFSGGGSVVLSTAAKEVIKAIAKKVIRDVTIKKLLVNIVREAVKQGLRSAGKELLGFTFGCATYGLGLSADESEEIGKTIVEGVWDEIGGEFPGSVKDAILDIPW